jgi:hypothetical protein
MSTSSVIWCQTFTWHDELVGAINQTQIVLDCALVCFSIRTLPTLEQKSESGNTHRHPNRPDADTDKTVATECRRFVVGMPNKAQ